MEPYEDMLVKMARNRKRAALSTLAIKVLLLLDIDVVRPGFWPRLSSMRGSAALWKIRPTFPLCAA